VATSDERFAYRSTNAIARSRPAGTSAKATRRSCGPDRQGRLLTAPGVQAKPGRHHSGSADGEHINFQDKAARLHKQRIESRKYAL
jgi:hypothetical protein